MLGDVVGEYAAAAISQNLPKIKNKYNIDFCVINAENAAQNGISPKIARTLQKAGADVLTMGNHTFRRAEDFIALSDSGFPIIRPANYPPNNPGFGYIIIEHNDVNIAVINLIGRHLMDAYDCPYRTCDKILEKIKAEAQIILVDFHAEATGEKVAMGYYLDGRVSAVAGTHTHIPTADEHILPNGTGYITDLGMCGASVSILGSNKEIVIKRVINRFADKNIAGDGPVEFDGVVLDIDEYTGKCLNITRIRELEGSISTNN